MEVCFFFLLLMWAYCVVTFESAIDLKREEEEREREREGEREREREREMMEQEEIDCFMLCYTYSDYTC